MKKLNGFLLLVLAVALVMCCVACEPDDPCAKGHNFQYGTCTVCGATDENFQPTDYVSQLNLDMSSDTKKIDVTVRNYVDGDTTHFYANDPAFEGGVLKARYLAVDTPESTNIIEPYGKTAANFTKEKLQSAAAIKVESDNSTWNVDSTGSRHLVWVWYQTQSGQWRNLNLELLQEGLANASNTSQNRYGSICVNALNQARALKYNMHSGEQDPNMYYGSAVELTLRELRTNIADYNGIKVAFEGVVITNDGSNGVYVQQYDEETNSYNGIYVYYGFSASAPILDALRPGNRVRIVGTCQLYETAGTYQIAGLSYKLMKPDDPENTQLIEADQQIVYSKLTAEDLLTRTISVEVTEVDEEGNENIVTKVLDYSEFVFNTAVEMSNLVVTSVYTTNNDASSSNGAMTLTCQVDGKTITVRTVVLYDADGNLVTEDYFLGKTITVRGIVESYDGQVQIKLLTLSNVDVA